MLVPYHDARCDRRCPTYNVACCVERESLGKIAPPIPRLRQMSTEHTEQALHHRARWQRPMGLEVLKSASPVKHLDVSGQDLCLGSRRDVEQPSDSCLIKLAHVKRCLVDLKQPCKLRVVAQLQCRFLGLIEGMRMAAHLRRRGADALSRGPLLSTRCTLPRLSRLSFLLRANELSSSSLECTMMPIEGIGDGACPVDVK